jgi:hypothetical protein
MVLGYVYFGPLFGKMYIQLMGLDKMDPVKSEEMKKGMMKSYVFAFIGSLVTAYVLSHMLVFATAYMKTSGVSAGLSTGFWVWLGFVAPVTMGMVLWGTHPWKLWVLNNGYNLIQLLMFGVILALWK